MRLSINPKMKIVSTVSESEYAQEVSMTNMN
jgi:hypothetical protein